MNPITPGTTFLIPLPEGNFGFGYVVFEGEALFINITNHISKEVAEIANTANYPLVLRDLFCDWASFRQRKTNVYPSLILKRKTIITNPLPLEKQWLILGNGNALHIVNGEQHKASATEKANYPLFAPPTPKVTYQKIAAALGMADKIKNN